MLLSENWKTNDNGEIVIYDDQEIVRFTIY